MKPTEIQSGSGGNQPATTTNQAPSNSAGQYPAQDGGGTGRDFPHFQTNFGFRPHFDDMFDDDDFGPHLRARMRRDPFAAFGGRKRCGFMPFDDPYRHYFTDESNLFPGFNDPEWDTMRSGRRRNAPQTGGAASNARGNIFDHIPAEFRNYIPENFGFHQPASQEYSQSYPPQQQQHYEGHPQQQQAQQPPQQHPPQQYQGYAEQPHQQQYRPKYCDASIQTDHDTDPENQSEHQNLDQHNLRNTMDFGQKSPQEGSNETRSHSAPPVNKRNYASASASAHAGVPDDTQTAYYTSTGTDPQTPQQYVGQPMPDAYQQRQQANYPPPPPQRQYVPPQYQNPPQHQQYTQQQAPPRAAQPAQNDGGFVRHVPIFIEGRSDPARHPPPQHEQQQPQSSRMPQQQQQQQPQPPPRMAPQQQQPQPPPRMAPQPQQQYHQQQSHPQERPPPLNTQQAQANAQINAQNNNQIPPGNQEQVPQTPQTTQCINKIQDIQRDVLNLLSQVEQFAGKKQDREYLYLDEMLTRNLLKLDTIDTNGKDSIRLARREAIKCIQASINVLEAKAEENAKAAQASVMETERPETGGENESNVIPLPCSEAQLVEAGKMDEQTQSNPSVSNLAVAPEEAESMPEMRKADTENPLTTEENKDTPVSAEPAETPVEEINEPCVKEDLDTDKLAGDDTEQLTQPNSEAELPPQKEEATHLEPPNEQIEKSSSEKENKPPGSPKKKIVRKVKKVASDKKGTSSTGDSTPDESTTPPSQEAAGSEATDQK